ncbi:MAG: prepilin peptidase [Campylobacterota bacterium]
MFLISFYIFSIFLSYTDYKYLLVPNKIVFAMVLMMLSFGLMESKIYISSIVLSLTVLIFFIALMLLKKDLFIGGGDIKYLMVIALYLDIVLFSYFLIITGVLQTLFLLYNQLIKNRDMAPMVPVMFLSVVIVEFLNIYWGFYDIK